MFPFVIWYVWANRNNNLYNNTTNKAHINHPYKLATEYKFLTEKEHKLQEKIPISIKWIKPNANHIKLNIDGSLIMLYQGVALVVYLEIAMAYGCWDSKALHMVYHPYM